VWTWGKKKESFDLSRHAKGEGKEKRKITYLCPREKKLNLFSILSEIERGVGGGGICSYSS